MFAEQDAQHERTACNLRNDRGDGRARDAHMESEDKNRVEHNVDDGAD